MSELKEEKSKCYYCDTEQYTRFWYDLNNSKYNKDRKSVPVCGVHFNTLCDRVYSTKHSMPNYLSEGQKEYLAVKRLEEEELGITTHHK